MATELKPCPFCGGNAKNVKLRNIAVKIKEAYYVECAVCRVRTMVELDIDTAIEAWNRRAENGTDCNL